MEVKRKEGMDALYCLLAFYNGTPFFTPTNDTRGDIARLGASAH